MKKTYVTPEIEKISFQYRDQVVVASGGNSGKCTYVYHNDEAGITSSCYSDHWESPEGI